MSLSTSYTSINSLGDFSFVGGSTYTLLFVVKDQSGSPIDLSNTTIRWKAAHYGTDYVIIDKAGSVISTNIFAIYLSTSDTESLAGKFSHQPQIVFSNGAMVVPAQGIITIIQGL